MKFAVFDIDGTLIRWQLYHSLVNELGKQGVLGDQAFSSIKAARAQWKVRKHPEAFKEYEHVMVTAYENMLTELSYTDFQKAMSTVIDEYKDQVYVYTRDLIKDLKDKGYMIFAISGSHTELVAEVAKYYGFDDFVGTVYPQINNRFTGEKILGSQNKAASLSSFMQKYNLTLEGSYAVGDSLSDVVMLELVENPIAFNPDRQLMHIAKDKGWTIVVERKNVIYTLEAHDGTYRLA